MTRFDLAASPAATGVVAVVAAIVVAAPLIEAHPAPNSSVELTFRARSVQAKLLLPVSELTYAMMDAPSLDPNSVQIDERMLRRYVAAHVSAESHDGTPWPIAVGTVKAETVDDHSYWAVDLTLTPPSDGDVSDLVLIDDAITREIRNHFIFASARASEGTASAVDVVGILQYPASRLSIPCATSRIHAAHSRFGSRAALVALLTAGAFLAARRLHPRSRARAVPRHVD